MFEEYFDDKLNNIDMLTKVYTREVIFGFIDYLITFTTSLSTKTPPYIFYFSRVVLTAALLPT